jgi:disulfide bond formation protein DsbB
MIRLPINATTWLLLGALASAALLAGAYSFQYLGGYAPCELCWTQRYIHFAALAVGAAGFALATRRSNVARPACLLLGLMFVASTIVAAYHAGIEWKWWPGPASCTGGHVGTITAADMAKLLSGNIGHIVQCDEHQPEQQASGSRHVRSSCHQRKACSAHRQRCKVDVALCPAQFAGGIAAQVLERVSAGQQGCGGEGAEQKPCRGVDRQSDHACIIGVDVYRSSSPLNAAI